MSKNQSNQSKIASGILGKKKLTDEEATAAGVDFSNGPQMSKSPFYRTGVSKSPLLDFKIRKHNHGTTKRAQKPKQTGSVELPETWQENNS